MQKLKAKSAYRAMALFHYELFPDLKNESFQFLIAQRLEFRNLDNPDGLYAHQEFVRRFMSPYSPYRSIILFHDLGSGKSIACTATAVDHYLHDGKECIIVTKGQSGAESFMAQIIQFKQMSTTKTRWNESIFQMQRYIKMSKQVAEMSDEEVEQAYSNKVIVLDEVHNIRYPGEKDLSECVYRSLMRIIQHCRNTKVMMATATPMTDKASQLEPLLQLCNYFQCGNFNSIDMNGIISYNPYVLDKPAIHFISNLAEGVYASRMIGHQKMYYEIHTKSMVPKDIYRSWTHLSLFCMPNGAYGKEITDTFMEKRDRKVQITPMSSEVTKEISYITYSPRAELSSMLYGNSLRNCSCKYSALLELLESTEGKVFVFVEEVKGSGIILLSAILEANGYEMYIGENLDQEMQPNPKRFTMCVGSSGICPNIQDRLDGFNSPLNKDGKYVRVLLGSKVIGESITLINVRHFHCITPHWNNSTINQAVGRVVRNGSHNALDPSERTVSIYMHTAIPYDIETSIDVIKLQTCQKKHNNIQLQEERMKEIAVDRYCIVNYDVAPPITEFKVFCAVYIRHHINTVLSMLHMTSDVCYDVTELSENLDINIEVMYQALCIIIRENIPYENRYLRAHENKVFLVDDCSLTYVMFPPRPRRNSTFSGQIVVAAEAEPDIQRPAGENAFAPGPGSAGENACSPSSEAFVLSAIEDFRHMPVRQKISYLERQIEQCARPGKMHFSRAPGLAPFLSTLFAIIDNKPCHLLWYRDIESAYTTSKAVPRKPQGKTRIFVNDKGWEYVVESKEQDYLDKYRDIYNTFLNEFELFQQPIYGIISTIDGKMRIRQRDDRPVQDSRKIKRGKNISSLKFSELADLIEHLGISGDYRSRIDMIHDIEKFLIEAELYCIV